MDLKSRKKNKPQVEEKLARSSSNQTKTQPVESSDEAYTHLITLRCNTLLYDTIQNMIASSHTSNDFTYTSVTDFIRAALQAYKDGMELTEVDVPGERKQTSIRVTQSQHDFYKSLPNQLRRQIIERAIRTFLKKQ